jgi:hypothetical protein
MTRTGEVQPGPVGYCSSAGAHAEGAAPSAQSSRAVVLCQVDGTALSRNDWSGSGSQATGTVTATLTATRVDERGRG